MRHVFWVVASAVVSSALLHTLGSADESKTSSNANATAPHAQPAVSASHHDLRAVIEPKLAHLNQDATGGHGHRVHHSHDHKDDAAATQQAEYHQRQHHPTHQHQHDPTTRDHGHAHLPRQVPVMDLPIASPSSSIHVHGQDNVHHHQHQHNSHHHHETEASGVVEEQAHTQQVYHHIQKRSEPDSQTVPEYLQDETPTELELTDEDGTSFGDIMTPLEPIVIVTPRSHGRQYKRPPGLRHLPMPAGPHYPYPRSLSQHILVRKLVEPVVPSDDVTVNETVRVRNSTLEEIEPFGDNTTAIARPIRRRVKLSLSKHSMNDNSMSMNNLVSNRQFIGGGCGGISTIGGIGTIGQIAQPISACQPIAVQQPVYVQQVPEYLPAINQCVQSYQQPILQVHQQFQPVNEIVQPVQPVIDIYDTPQQIITQTQTCPIYVSQPVVEQTQTLQVQPTFTSGFSTIGSSCGCGRSFYGNTLGGFDGLQLSGNRYFWF